MYGDMSYVLSGSLTATLLTPENWQMAPRGNIVSLPIPSFFTGYKKICRGCIIRCVLIYDIIYMNIWVVPKIVVPQNGWFIMENLFKWMIWGYHYFRKHPCIYVYIHSIYIIIIIINISPKAGEVHHSLG